MKPALGYYDVQEPAHGCPDPPSSPAIYNLQEPALRYPGATSMPAKHNMFQHVLRNPGAALLQAIQIIQAPAVRYRYPGALLPTT